MSFAATASTSAAAATRFSARAADVSNGGGKRCAAAAAARAPASSASTRRTGGSRNHTSGLVVRCNNNKEGEWPAPAVPPARNQGSDRRDMLTRYHEIANMDPNDPKALDIIGSKTPCKVQFNVPYETAMGEEVMIIGSHEKLGAWNQDNAMKLTWSEGGVWRGSVELQAGGVFFYKYVVKTLHEGYKWQEGANNLLVLPDAWDIPEGSVFMVEDVFAGLSRSSQNQLATKLISVEKQIVQLKMESAKAKEMTKASLQELLLTREQLAEANQKLEHYERNVQTVISSMQDRKQAR